MPLIYYVFLDLRLLFFSLFFSLSSTFFLFATFKDEVLFFFCLPYIRNFSTNAFLLNNLVLIFFMYPIFLQKLLLLVSPYLILPPSFFILFRNFCRLTIKRFFSVFLFYFVLLPSVLYWLFPYLLKSVLSLTDFFSPSLDHAFHFKMDFTVNSWLSFLFAFFFIVYFFLFFLAFFSFLVFTADNPSTVFWMRTCSFLVFSVIAVLFIPYDASVHFLTFLVYLIFTEFIFLFRFFLFRYGRVA